MRKLNTENYDDNELVEKLEVSYNIAASKVWKEHGAYLPQFAASYRYELRFTEYGGKYYVWAVDVDLKTELDSVNGPEYYYEFDSKEECDNFIKSKLYEFEDVDIDVLEE